ncbi:hypothetical protein L227DRAFT_615585 [Lentinus tigrinus ALCF2SS1-6]|uniref:DUF6697 domain-containing protein n=1 Tax=Lentinus tigrinus ALCF2SS1-6 TaxID=1328759 RepID=A0A5C2RTX0_9APHY|nr:hypothetical protein L227DRAFT_615585 [Lentinus tigrinus ALCF2SS1-6]
MAVKIKRSPSPPPRNGNDAPTGTRDNPVQICQTDEEDGAPAGPSLVASTRRQARNARRREKIDLGMIELSDSENEVVRTATADPPSGRKRKKSAVALKEEPVVKIEAGVLRENSSYKQRKLNHADDDEDDKSNVSTQAEGEKTESGIIAADELEQAPFGSLLNKEFLLKDEDLLELVSRDSLKPFPITLASTKRSVTVTREQLSRRFGGSTMDTFPRPHKNRIAVHGRANFMCISLDWNPHGPQKPGHGGLFFETTVWPGDAWTANLKHSRTQVLFVKLQQWGNLPVHEKVRATWASEISESGWGKPIRARIHLRRTLGRDPTREEVENELGAFKDVSKDDVRDAVDSGNECICAWSMKCIGYDEDFQLELIELSESG